MTEIVITLDVPWRPEPDLDEEQIAAQRIAIAAAQAELIDALDGTNFTVTQLFEMTPQMAVAVDDAALAVIESSPLVLTVGDGGPDPAG